MIRRIALAIALVGAVGASVAVAGGMAQKDKPKTADQTPVQRDKEIQAAESRSPLMLDLGGEGGYLGVYLEEVTAERAKELGLREERGAVVMKVVSGSPAEKAGLKENDVLVSFNGRRVDSVRELQRLLGETPADRSVQIEVIRGGSSQTISATLAKRSLSNYRLFGPEVGGRLVQPDSDAMKKLDEALKESQDALRKSQEKMRLLPRDFGDFSFVNPGEFSFFGGRRLGISAESLTDQLAEFFGVKEGKGVLVVSVDENGAAAKAGIKAGDVITAVGEDKVDSVRAFMRALSSKEEGTFPVKIVRNRVEQSVNVTLERQETPRRRALAATRRAVVV